MEHIFYTKKKSILFVMAILLLVVLVCMLLTVLVQHQAVEQRAEQLALLIKQAKQDEQSAREQLAYMLTDEYIVNWAIENGMVKQEDITWIEQNIK